MKFILIILLVIVIFKIYKEKIHIDFKSFFKRGFKKIDNKFGLFCYTGKQGKGKTYSAIKFITDQKIKYNYTILTNVKSFDLFKDTIYFTDINDIIDYCVQFKGNDKNVIIFFDEIFTILEKKTPINKKILSFLSQLRKRKIIFVTTAQEWSEINITFRRYVRYQISCNMISLPIFKTAIIYNTINDGDLIRWNNDTQDFEAPRISANLSKGNEQVINSYDTFETIQTNYIYHNFLNLLLL